jgi:hypothetical protein
VNGFVIEGEPLLKSFVDAVKGVGNGCVTIEELIANPSKISLYFSSTSGLAWWSVDKMDTEVGADKFQMVAGITGAVIGVETDRLAVNSDGGHQFLHHHLGILGEKEAGVDHIAGGVIDNGVQVGLAFLAVHPDLRPMEKIGGPELAEILIGKSPRRLVGYEMRIPVQIGGRREAVEGGAGWIGHIPQFLVDQLSEDAGQSPPRMLFT